MKKTTICLLTLSIFSLIGCNNLSSDAQKKHVIDSIKEADSVNQVNEEKRIIDSISTVTKEQEIIQDSIMKLVGD